MNKKRIIAIVFIIIISLAVIGLYQTFAISSTATSTDDNTYSINLGDSSTVTVPANSSKTIYYKLTNTNNGTVNYGIGYSGTDIVVYEWHDSNDSATGTIGYQENKFIKLYIKNNGDTSNVATINTILGYENDNNLIMPDGVTLVGKLPIATYISWLYDKANKTEIQHIEGVTYNYATSASLMNDGLGSVTEDLDGGNIRYYGNDPDNYIYFNCGVYPSTNCELWRIIGVFNDKVKIMRVGSIGTFSWDTSASNANRGFGIADWNEADLMKLLNPNYEENYDLDSSGNSILVNNSLYWQGADGEAGNCYNGKLNSTTPCNLTNNGLKNTATRNMISDSLYYLDGIKSDIELYVNEIYDYEKNGNTWYGKIALANVADLGYAADLNICKENLKNYFDESCFSTNWMFSIYTSDSWLLNSNAPAILSTGSYYWGANGIFTSEPFVGNSIVFTSYEIVPVLYLDSDVFVETGKGTIGNPYKINLIS